LAGLLKPSFIPPKEQRELRDLTRFRIKLVQQIASDKNRILRVLEDCNIKLSNVLSNTQGVVGTKLIDKLCDGEEITMSDIDQVYHRKLGASKEELYEACQGLMTDHNIYLLQMIRQDIVAKESIINELNKRIKTKLMEYDNVLERLKKIPGLDTRTIENLLAEIGLDMSVFPSANHLASWAGICPGNNESAGKKKADAPITGTNR